MNENKEQLITQLQQERADFESIIAPISEDQMVDIELFDGWTVKDVLAHITAWEVELLHWLESVSKGTAPDLPKPGEWMPYIETFNKGTYLENRDCSLEEVKRRFDQVYKQVLTSFLSLPEDEEDDFWSIWLDGEPPWILFATFHEHYKEHGEQIRSRMLELSD